MRFAKTIDELMAERRGFEDLLEKKRVELLERMRQPDCFYHEIISRRNEIDALVKAINGLGRKIVGQSRRV